MNQKKIGNFIAKKRTEKKITQSELGEQLGVTDKAVSNWENGKNMPDLSLFKPLCQALDITINELLSGEEIEDKEYQEKLEENIIDMVNKVSKKEEQKRRKMLLFILPLIVLLGYLFWHNIIENMELKVKYDNRIMKCHFDDNHLIYEIKGVSIINTKYEEINIGKEKIYFFTSKIDLANKIRSHWESWESMAELANEEEPKFASEFKIETNKGDKIKVYHTDKSLKKIKKATKEELKEIINKSNLMCEYN